MRQPDITANTDYILCPKELAEDLMKEFEDA
jgi:hypothetical protein